MIDEKYCFEERLINFAVSPKEFFEQLFKNSPESKNL